MQILYRFLWFIAVPILPLYLKIRQNKGKEEATRIKERYGYGKHKRKKGKLLWLHAASIGEVNSILPLIERLHERHGRKYNFLLTTASRNGQNIAEKSAPSYVAVQYLPLDYGKAAMRFLDHYEPFAALWVEQELWPNILQEAQKRGIHLALINGRLTQKSVNRWKRLGGFSHKLGGYFDCVLASSPNDRDNFKEIGFKAQYIGNLKALPKREVKKTNEAKISLPKKRRFWLAASLHKNEELVCFEAHKLLQKSMDDLFLLLVPRYPHQSVAMQENAARLGIKAVLHSEASAKDIASADCLIIDAFGLLNELYKKCDVAFLGGSMGRQVLGYDVGGHNPLEAIQNDCFVICGEDMHNFSDVMLRLHRVGSLQKVDSVARSLQQALRLLLSNDGKRQGGIKIGKQILQDLSIEAETTASHIGNWIEGKL